MFLISSEKAILETLHGTISWTLVTSVLLHKAALYSLLQSSPLPSKNTIPDHLSKITCRAFAALFLYDHQHRPVELLGIVTLRFKSL